MGLDTSHGCWHGAYSAFMRWRQELCKVAGLPPLDLMEGFFEKGSYRDPFREMAREFPASAAAYYDCLPIKWSSLRDDPYLYELLNHSDCEGELAAEVCGPLADRLAELLPLLSPGDGGGHIGNWRDKTQTFIDGLRVAASAKEAVAFH